MTKIHPQKSKNRNSFLPAPAGIFHGVIELDTIFSLGHGFLNFRVPGQKQALPQLMMTKIHPQKSKNRNSFLPLWRGFFMLHLHGTLFSHWDTAFSIFASRDRTRYSKVCSSGGGRISSFLSLHLSISASLRLSISASLHLSSLPAGHTPFLPVSCPRFPSLHLPDSHQLPAGHSSLLHISFIIGRRRVRHGLRGFGLLGA